MAWRREDLLILSAARLHVPLGSIHGVREDLSGLLGRRDLIERAIQHGLGGLLYSSLKDMLQLDERGEEGLRHFKKAYHSTLAANLQAMAEFGKLAETLKGESIPFLVVQGAAIVPSLYGGRLGLRPLGDIDIIVLKKDLSRARRIILREGYRPEEHYPDLFSRRGVVVDVHTDSINSERLPSRRRLTSVLEGRLWENATILQDELMGDVMVPSPQDHFLLLCLHVMKHSFSRRIWAVDLAEMLRTFTLTGSCIELVRASEETGLQRPLLYSLLYLRKAFGPGMSDGMMEELPMDMGRMEKRVVEMVINNEPLPRAGDLLFLFSLQGSRDRARFVWETFMPRRHLMARAAAAGRREVGPGFFVSRAGGALSMACRLGLKLLFGIPQPDGTRGWPRRMGTIWMKAKVNLCRGSAARDAAERDAI